MLLALLGSGSAPDAPGRGRRARVRAAPRGLLAEGGSRRSTNVPGFSLDQADRTWVDSLLFDPRTLLVLLPLALLGLLAVPRWQAALLGAAIATNAVLYTFYEHTHLHPRFLDVTLPALFVLQAAGAWLVIRKAFEGPVANAGYDRANADFSRHGRCRLSRLSSLPTRSSSAVIAWFASTTWRRARSANIEHMRTDEFVFHARMI